MNLIPRTVWIFRLAYRWDFAIQVVGQLGDAEKARTEKARTENAAPSGRGGKGEKGKRGTKWQGWKWRERKTRHQSAGVEMVRTEKSGNKEP